MTGKIIFQTDDCKMIFKNYDWNENVEYIMTSDGLQPVHQPEVDDDNNDNEQEAPPVPSEPKPIDSSRYHYQPSKDSPANDAKTTQAKMFKQTPVKASVKITDFASAFFERFSL